MVFIVKNHQKTELHTEKCTVMYLKSKLKQWPADHRAKLWAA